MSEDKTKDIARKYDTNPTIETVLERINDLREILFQKFGGLEVRFDDLDVRVDRMEGVVNATRAEMLTLRADYGGMNRRITGLEESRA